jgi:hypothetical protein
MKIKTKQIVETETELQLPYFYKTDDNFVAILGEKLYIKLYHDSVVKFNSEHNHFPTSYQQITAEKFTAEYDKVLEQLGQLKSQFFVS